MSQKSFVEEWLDEYIDEWVQKWLAEKGEQMLHGFVLEMATEHSEELYEQLCSQVSREQQH